MQVCRRIADGLQNRDYATAQIKDLAAKLSSAKESLGKSAGHLKLREAPITGTAVTSGAPKEDVEADTEGQWAKPKIKGGLLGDYNGVDEEKTALSKATQDGYVDRP